MADTLHFAFWMLLGSKPKRGCVYELLDPRDGGIRYVGNTTHNPRERVLHLLDKARNGSQSPLGRGIRRMLALGITPTVAVRAIVADAAEALRLGDALTGLRWAQGCAEWNKDKASINRAEAALVCRLKRSQP